MDDTTDSSGTQASSENNILDKLLNLGLEAYKGTQTTTNKPATATPDKTYGGFTVAQWVLGGAALVLLIVLVRVFTK